MSKSNKWYAVREGREAGIYSNWEAAREQVHGYSNNEHRSFKSVHQAADYMQGQDNYSQDRYYAVGKGHSTGVYDNWKDARQATDGYSGAEFKRHDSAGAAQQWLQDHKK